MILFAILRAMLNRNSISITTFSFLKEIRDTSSSSYTRALCMLYKEIVWLLRTYLDHTLARLLYSVMGMFSKAFFISKDFMTHHCIFRSIRAFTAKTAMACEIYFLIKKVSSTRIVCISLVPALAYFLTRETLQDIVQTLTRYPKLKLSAYMKALQHLKSDLDDLHEAELGLSLGPPMTDEQIRATKKRVENSIMEIEIEIETIKLEISGKGVPGKNFSRRYSTSFMTPGQNRVASVELLKKLQAQNTELSGRPSMTGRTFSLREEEGEGDNGDEGDNADDKNKEKRSTD